MSVVVLTGAGHAPGVTTTALGLALAWPGPVLVVDADRVPTQAALAGYLQGEEVVEKGLWEVLSAHRERRDLGPAIERASFALPGWDGESRRFLPGFPHPGMVELFASAWPEFVAALAAREEDVLVDAGDIGVRGLPPALTTQAGQVVVVTGSSLPDLAALRLYLPLLTDAVPAERLSALVIGPGRPYTAAEVGLQFGVEVAGSIDWAPADAAVLSHGGPVRRAFESGGYLRSLRHAAARLDESLRDRRERIGAPR